MVQKLPKILKENLRMNWSIMMMSGKMASSMIGLCVSSITLSLLRKGIELTIAQVQRICEIVFGSLIKVLIK